MIVSFRGRSHGAWCSPCLPGREMLARSEFVICPLFVCMCPCFCFGGGGFFWESGVKELLSTIVVLEVRDIHPEAGDSLIGQRAGAGMKSSSGASVAWMSNFEGCVFVLQFRVFIHGVLCDREFFLEIESMFVRGLARRVSFT